VHYQLYDTYLDARLWSCWNINSHFWNYISTFLNTVNKLETILKFELTAHLNFFIFFQKRKFNEAKITYGTLSSIVGLLAFFELVWFFIGLINLIFKILIIFFIKTHVK